MLKKVIIKENGDTKYVMYTTGMIDQYMIEQTLENNGMIIIKNGSKNENTGRNYQGTGRMETGILEPNTRTEEKSGDRQGPSGLETNKPGDRAGESLQSTEESESDEHKR
ncbi:hypothetical protein [Tortoise microvirus 11]|nr:hypothetical protein [Tortoise microvirus 11]